MPKAANRGDYEVVAPGSTNKEGKPLVPNSVWKVTIPEQGSADIEFCDGAGLQVQSNNSSAIQNPIPEISSGSVRILTLIGLKEGTTMIEVTPTAGRGSEPLQVNVIKVEAPKTFGEMVALEPPSMALNSHDTPVVFEMHHTFVIAPTTPAQQIVDTARSKGKLRHLAISCHSYVDKATGATRLDIGMGFDASNTGLFTQLGETIGGGVLWFAGCAACGSEQGKNDVKARATNARCYAVGPVMFMSVPKGTRGKLHLAKSMVDMRARFMPVVFTPAGSTVAWNVFLGMGSRLGFSAKA